MHELAERPLVALEMGGSETSVLLIGEIGTRTGRERR